MSLIVRPLLTRAFRWPVQCVTVYHATLTYIGDGKNDHSFFTLSSELIFAALSPDATDGCALRLQCSQTNLAAEMAKMYK